MFSKLLVGNEKAVIGGLTGGILSLLGQVGVNSQITLKEIIYAVATWVVTHSVIWLSANTPKSHIVFSPPSEVVPPTPPTESTHKYSMLR